MQVTSLALRDFRNYAQARLGFPAGVTLLLGENAQGKSNLIEALRLLSTGRSLRTANDAELIRTDAESAFLSSEWLTADGRAVEVELGMAAGTRRYRVNGVVKARLADWVGRVFTVLFSGDDLRIIQDPPGARRDFLDTELTALSRKYAVNLLHYRRAVEQRNRLLRSARAGVGAADLSAWDEQVAQYGGPLMHARSEFIQRLNAAAPDQFERLTSATMRLVIEYAPALGDELLPATAAEVTERLRALLPDALPDQIARGATLAGPHRDDLRFLLDGRDLRAFGSRGEQRAALVAVRVNLAAVIAGVAGETPVLLLDDVFSELDADRREALGHALGDAEQVIVTATDEATVPAALLSAAARVRVRAGTLEPLGAAV